MTSLVSFVPEHRENIISRRRLVRMAFLEVRIAHQVPTTPLQQLGICRVSPHLIPDTCVLAVVPSSSLLFRIRGTRIYFLVTS